MCVCEKECVCEYDIFWCISLCLFLVFLFGFFLLTRGSRVLLLTTVRNSVVTSSWIYRCDEAWHHLSRQGSSPRLEREEDWRVCECNMRMRVPVCLCASLSLSVCASLPIYAPVHTCACECVLLRLCGSVVALLCDCASITSCSLAHTLLLSRFFFAHTPTYEVRPCRYLRV